MENSAREPHRLPAFVCVHAPSCRHSPGRAPTPTRCRSIRQRTQIVQYASYALWVGSAGLSLFVVPFVYFFYEEEELYGFEVRVR
jgi:hypothetical protein